MNVFNNIYYNFDYLNSIISSNLSFFYDELTIKFNHTYLC